MSEMVKKYKIAPFLNTAKDASGFVDKTTPTWTRIKKTASFDLNLNPETEDYDYIADENPTTELKDYKPSFNTPLVMYKGEADYEFVFDKMFNLDVGSKAKSEILLVFFQHPVDEQDTPSHFKAWKADCALSVNDLNSVDSTITFDVLFGGTVSKGYVTVTNGTPVYTEGTYTA